MAKGVRLFYRGLLVYPKTVTSEVIDPDTGKALSEVLKEKTSSGISDVPDDGQSGYVRIKGEWKKLALINGKAIIGDNDIIIYNHWFGTKEQYAEIKKIDPYTIYHVGVQPDWDEADENSLGFIRNKPKLLSLEITGKVAKFINK